MADIFAEHDLGCILPDDPWRASQLVKSNLSNREQLIEWSNRASTFAEQNFHPRVVSLRYVEFYEASVRAAKTGVTV